MRSKKKRKKVNYQPSSSEYSNYNVLENDLVELGRKKMKELENTIETMRMEAQKGIKERDLQIEFLGKELKKNANVQYIKNILINFLTNPDYTVREKVIPVLGTVLQFSPIEFENVKTAWEKDHKSLLGKGSTQVSSVKALIIFTFLILFFEKYSGSVQNSWELISRGVIFRIEIIFILRVLEYICGILIESGVD